MQANLKAVGLDVEIKAYTFAVMAEKAGTRGEPFDIVSIGWFADYPDPYDFINILLDGRTIAAKNNINLSYFDKPVYRKKMDAAAALSGDARYRAYGNLDIDITRNQSPLVITSNQNVRESSRRRSAARPIRSPGVGSTSCCSAPSGSSPTAFADVLLETHAERVRPVRPERRDGAKAGTLVERDRRMLMDPRLQPE